MATNNHVVQVDDITNTMYCPKNAVCVERPCLHQVLAKIGADLIFYDCLSFERKISHLEWRILFNDLNWLMDNTSCEIIDRPEYLLKIMMLLKQITRIISSQNKNLGLFPHSKEFYSLLARSVRLECDVLFSSPNERLIKVHIEKRLVSSFTSLLYDTNRRLTRNIRSYRSAAFLNTLFIFTLVAKECKERYDYLEEMAVILVKELNMLGDFSKLLAERECFSVQKMLRQPHFRIVYRFFQRCNRYIYSTNTDPQSLDDDCDFDDDAPIYNVPHKINGIMLKPKKEKFIMYFLEALATPAVDKPKVSRSERFLVRSPASVSLIKATEQTNQTKKRSFASALRLSNDVNVDIAAKNDLAVILHNDLNQSLPGCGKTPRKPSQIVYATQQTLSTELETFEELETIATFQATITTHESDLHGPIKPTRTDVSLPLRFATVQVFEEEPETLGELEPDPEVETFVATSLVQEPYLDILDSNKKTDFEIATYYAEQQTLPDFCTDSYEPLVYKPPFSDRAIETTHESELFTASISKCNTDVACRYVESCSLPNMYDEEPGLFVPKVIPTFNAVCIEQEPYLNTCSMTRVETALPIIYSQGSCDFVEDLEVPKLPLAISLPVTEEIPETYEMIAETSGFQMAACLPLQRVVPETVLETANVRVCEGVLPVQYLEMALEAVQPLDTTLPFETATCREHESELHTSRCEEIEVFHHKVPLRYDVKIPFHRLSKKLCKYIHQKKGLTYCVARAKRIRVTSSDMSGAYNLRSSHSHTSVSSAANEPDEFDNEPDDESSELQPIVNDIINMLGNTSDPPEKPETSEQPDNLDLLATVANARSKITPRKPRPRKRKRRFSRKRPAKRRKIESPIATSETPKNVVVMPLQTNLIVPAVPVCDTSLQNDLLKLKTIPFKKRKSYRESDTVEVVQEIDTRPKKKRKKSAFKADRRYNRVTRSITAQLQTVPCPRTSRSRSVCALDDADADELVYSVTEEYEDLKNESLEEANKLKTTSDVEKIEVLPLSKKQMANLHSKHAALNGTTQSCENEALSSLSTLTSFSDELIPSNNNAVMTLGDRTVATLHRPLGFVHSGYALSRNAANSYILSGSISTSSGNYAVQLSANDYAIQMNTADYAVRLNTSEYAIQMSNNECALQMNSRDYALHINNSSNDYPVPEGDYAIAMSAVVNYVTPFRDALISNSFYTGPTYNDYAALLLNHDYAAPATGTFNCQRDASLSEINMQPDTLDAFDIGQNVAASAVYELISPVHDAFENDVSFFEECLTNSNNSLLSLSTIESVQEFLSLDLTFLGEEVSFSNTSLRAIEWNERAPTKGVEVDDEHVPYGAIEEISCALDKSPLAIESNQLSIEGPPALLAIEGTPKVIVEPASAPYTRKLVKAVDIFDTSDDVFGDISDIPLDDLDYECASMADIDEIQEVLNSGSVTSTPNNRPPKITQRSRSFNEIVESLENDIFNHEASETLDPGTLNFDLLDQCVTQSDSGSFLGQTDTLNLDSTDVSNSKLPSSVAQIQTDVSFCVTSPSLVNLTQSSSNKLPNLDMPSLEIQMEDVDLLPSTCKTPLASVDVLKSPLKTLTPLSQADIEVSMPRTSSPSLLHSKISLPFCVTQTSCDSSSSHTSSPLLPQTGHAAETNLTSFAVSIPLSLVQTSFVTQTNISPSSVTQTEVSVSPSSAQAHTDILPSLTETSLPSSITQTKLSNSKALRRAKISAPLTQTVSSSVIQIKAPKSCIARAEEPVSLFVTPTSSLCSTFRNDVYDSEAQTSSASFDESTTQRTLSSSTTAVELNVSETSQSSCLTLIKVPTPSSLTRPNSPLPVSLVESETRIKSLPPTTLIDLSSCNALSSSCVIQTDLTSLTRTSSPLVFQTSVLDNENTPSSCVTQTDLTSITQTCSSSCKTQTDLTPLVIPSVAQSNEALPASQKVTQTSSSSIAHLSNFDSPRLFLAQTNAPLVFQTNTSDYETLPSCITQTDFAPLALSSVAHTNEASPPSVAQTSSPSLLTARTKKCSVNRRLLASKILKPPTDLQNTVFLPSSITRVKTSNLEYLPSSKALNIHSMPDISISMSCKTPGSPSATCVTHTSPSRPASTVIVSAMPSCLSKSNFDIVTSTPYLTRANNDLEIFPLSQNKTIKPVASVVTVSPVQMTSQAQPEDNVFVKPTAPAPRATVKSSKVSIPFTITPINRVTSRYSTTCASTSSRKSNVDHGLKYSWDLHNSKTSTSATFPVIQINPTNSKMHPCDFETPLGCSITLVKPVNSPCTETNSADSLSITPIMPSSSKLSSMEFSKDECNFLSSLIKNVRHRSRKRLPVKRLGKKIFESQADWEMDIPRQLFFNAEITIRKRKYGDIETCAHFGYPCGCYNRLFKKRRLEIIPINHQTEAVPSLGKSLSSQESLMIYNTQTEYSGLKTARKSVTVLTASVSAPQDLRKESKKRKRGVETEPLDCSFNIKRWHRVDYSSIESLIEVQPTYKRSCYPFMEDERPRRDLPQINVRTPPITIPNVDLNLLTTFLDMPPVGVTLPTRITTPQVGLGVPLRFGRPVEVSQSDSTTSSVFLKNSDVQTKFFKPLPELGRPKPLLGITSSASVHDPSKSERTPNICVVTPILRSTGLVRPPVKNTGLPPVSGSASPSRTRDRRKAERAVSLCDRRQQRNRPNVNNTLFPVSFRQPGDDGIYTASDLLRMRYSGSFGRVCNLVTPLNRDVQRPLFASIFSSRIQGGTIHLSSMLIRIEPLIHGQCSFLLQTSPVQMHLAFIAEVPMQHESERSESLLFGLGKWSLRTSRLSERINNFVVGFPPLILFNKHHSKRGEDSRAWISRIERQVPNALDVRRVFGDT